MAKHFRLAFSLFVLVALSTAVSTVIPEEQETPPTPQEETPYPPDTPSIPETTYTEGTPNPPDTPSTPESPVIYSDPPLSSPDTPETPFTHDVPVTPPTTEIPSEEDTPEPPPDHTNGCENNKPFDGPCAECECNDGGWVCLIKECRQECVNGYMAPGACCQTCPDGPNCEINGQIIPLGETVEGENGEECTCQKNENFWGPPEAICIPKKPSCTDSSGPMMDSPCMYCNCDENSGGWYCLDRPCYPPLCVDITKSDDGCCDECPNGYNCEAFGEIIPWGEVRTLSNGQICTCEFNWYWDSSSPMQAQCISAPPVSTPDNTPESSPENTAESSIPENTPESSPENTPPSTPENTPESSP